MTEPLNETPGQKAVRLVREARVLLEDPAKAEYHDRLTATIEAMEAQLDFWGQLAAINALLDVANERTDD